MELSQLLPRADLLAAAVALDAAFGDPVYRLHPVRLMGASLTWVEARLRMAGADGRVGGCLLFAVLSAVWVGGASVLLLGLAWLHSAAASLFHVFALYSLLALGDLLRHGAAVERAAAAGDLRAAQAAAGKLVGRDTDSMDAAACRRAAMESLAENLADGFVASLLWYALAGLPGAVLFKCVSTMDSMVGYKTAAYLRFGWCGARLDDLMNLIPARLTWLLTAAAALALPGCSARKALRVGWRQHALVPGPNAGWAEAALAGAAQRRLIGPIRQQGRLVTEIWLGDGHDPPAGSAEDYRRAARLVAAAGGLGAAGALAGLLLL